MRESGTSMTVLLLRFFALLVVSLVVGTIFGIVIGYNPKELSAVAYTEQQQHAIRSLNVLMPILGGIGIALSLILAANAKHDRKVIILLVTAAIFLLVAGVVTRFGNQPINAVVMTWDAHNPPADWKALGDAWWKWHLVRTAAGLCALICLIASGLIPHSERAKSSPGSTR